MEEISNEADNKSEIQLGLSKTLGGFSRENAQNRNNAFTQTVGNLVYGYERYKDKYNGRTQDIYPSGNASPGIKLKFADREI